MNVFLDFLGCRLNEAEQASWQRQLSAAGHLAVRTPEEADITVVNTCAVTTAAAKKSRQLIRQFHRRNPRSKLVVTGCYATLEPEKIATLMGVDLVIPNRSKDQLAVKISELIEEDDFLGETRRAAEPNAEASFAHNRTRAFIKVQDGCRNRCSFCIVTVARGNERSRHLSEIITEAQHLCALGYKELVITGVHLGGYGSDIQENLTSLITALLNDTDIPRIRIGSLEPWDFPEDFISLFSSKRLCRHLHLPLQSGSNTILKRMIRRCTVDSYSAIVEQLRSFDSSFTVTSDFIVGFPGETEREFQETITTLERLKLADLHLFPYSLRTGTAASRLPNHLPKAIKQKRLKVLKQIGEKHQEQHLQSMLNQVRPVLWERDAERLSSGLIRWHGYTDNYVRTICETTPDIALFNQIEKIKLHRLSKSTKATLQGSRIASLEA